MEDSFDILACRYYSLEIILTIYIEVCHLKFFATLQAKYTCKLIIPYNNTFDDHAL